MKCKAGFNSYAELLAHRKEHQVFRAKCLFPKCGRIFSQAYLLYDHEAQHYNTYTCKFTGCGKVYRSQSEMEKHLDDHSAPEKVLPPPEGQLNPSGNEVTANSEGSAGEGRAQTGIEKSLGSDSRGGEWETDKADPAATSQGQLSAAELQQADIPLSNGLENPDSTTVLRTNEVAVSIKVSVNHGVEDDFGKPGNLTVEGAGEPLVTDVHKPGVGAAVHLCHPGFQEKKDHECLNEAQIAQNSLASSESLKMCDLNPHSLERQVNTLMTFSVQNEAGLEDNSQICKFECGGDVKTSSSLYDLPLKTLESITYVPSQPDLSSPLGSPSVPPKAPGQKFRCQVEGCTRAYNSSQSIGKHMKTAHPDQYAAFKLQRKTKKGQKSNNLSTPNHGKCVYFLPSQVSSSNHAFFYTTDQSQWEPCLFSPVAACLAFHFPSSFSKCINSIVTLSGKCPKSKYTFSG